MKLASSRSADARPARRSRTPRQSSPVDLASRSSAVSSAGLLPPTAGATLRATARRLAVEVDATRHYRLDKGHAHAVAFQYVNGLASTRQPSPPLATPKPLRFRRRDRQKTEESRFRSPVIRSRNRAGLIRRDFLRVAVPYVCLRHEVEAQAMNSLDHYRPSHTHCGLSPIALGTMTFGQDWGWGADAGGARISVSSMRRASSTTSMPAVNSTMSSERLVGEFIEESADRIVLATKFAVERQQQAIRTRVGNHRLDMLRSVQQGLRQLNATTTSTCSTCTARHDRAGFR